MSYSSPINKHGDTLPNAAYFIVDPLRNKPAKARYVDKHRPVDTTFADELYER